MKDWGAGYLPSKVDSFARTPSLVISHDGQIGVYLHGLASDRHAELISSIFSFWLCKTSLAALNILNILTYLGSNVE